MVQNHTLKLLVMPMQETTQTPVAALGRQLSILQHNPSIPTSHDEEAGM